MAKGHAEAVEVDTASNWVTYNFTDWLEVSALKDLYERDQTAFLKTIKQPVAVPWIVRVTNFARFRKSSQHLNRRNVYARDRNQCQYCGKVFRTQDLNLDHVIPKCQGGRSTWENLVCSCFKCNTKKAGRSPAQAGMTLIRRPVVSKKQAVKVNQFQLKTWQHFLDESYWLIELKD